MRRALALGALACWSLACVSGAAAADAKPAKAEPCTACHGAEGRSSMPEVPSLAGQPAYYTALQLILFREKQRESPLMAPFAEDLSDSEMQELGAYFAALPASSGSGTQDAAGAEGGRIAQGRHCASCHLPTYAGQNQVPRLAGQREDYLARTMKAYRDGQRIDLDGTMVEVMHGLSDQEIASLARYLSQLE